MLRLLSTGERAVNIQTQAAAAPRVHLLVHLPAAHNWAGWQITRDVDSRHWRPTDW
jgi:hypothetical protein